MKKQIIVLLIFLPNIIIGQDELSLIDAIDLAMWGNYEIQITSKDQDISKINNNWADAGAIPKFNLSAKKEEALSDQSNNPASFIQEKLQSSSISASANISWTLFNGFAIRANKQKLKNLEKISNNNSILTIETQFKVLFFNIIIAYFKEIDCNYYKKL